MKAATTKLLITLLSTCLILYCILPFSLASEANAKCGGGGGCKPIRTCDIYGNCPRPSPTVPRAPSLNPSPIPTLPSPDIYPVPPVINRCLLLPRELTSLTNIPLTNCLNILKCLTWWTQHYLQFVLRGLTTGAELPLSVETNGAIPVMFTEFERILGQRINEAGNGVDSPVPDVCTAEYAPVLAADGRIYSNACVARRSGAPYPYTSVTVQNSAINPAFPTDVTNARIALTRHYLCAALRIVRFLLTFLNSCLLSTDTRVLNDAVDKLRQADNLILSGDLNGAKSLVLAVTNTI
ncbi:hypothetical protein ABK040_010911 [Willaertia magna]